MEISPGKSIFFHSIAAESTVSIILENRGLGLCNDVLAHPILQPLIQFVFLSTKFCILASAQCIPRVKPPCGLLMVQGLTPAHKELAPSRLITYLR